METTILWGSIESLENHMSLLFPLRAQRARKLQHLLHIGTLHVVLGSLCACNPSRKLDKPVSSFASVSLASKLLVEVAAFFAHVLTQAACPVCSRSVNVRAVISGAVRPKL